MGGRIAVTSAPGEGATFQAVVALPPAEGSAAPFAPPDLDGVAVLIVAPVHGSLVDRAAPAAVGEPM